MGSRQVNDDTCFLHFGLSKYRTPRAMGIQTLVFWGVKGHRRHAPRNNDCIGMVPCPNHWGLVLPCFSRWPKLQMGLYRFANSGPRPRPSRAKPQQISVPRRNCMAAPGVCTSHRGNSALGRVSHWLSMSSFMIGGIFRYPRVVMA